MGFVMYRKQDKNQLTMDEFAIVFGDGLRRDNRWVRMAGLIPWELVDEIFARSLSME